MRINIFGSKDCERCEKLKEAICAADLDYYWFDVDDPYRQEWYDQKGIDELPHVEIMSEDGSKLLYKFVGNVNAKTITAAVKLG